MSKPIENTTNPRPVGLTRGDGNRLETGLLAEASRRSAENARARGAVPPRPGVPPQAPAASTPEAEGSFVEAFRRSAQNVQARGATVHRTSSQAGLSAARGPRHAYGGAPSPGEPGARFTPVVRQSARGAQQRPSPDMITEVPERLRIPVATEGALTPQQEVEATVKQTDRTPAETVRQADETGLAGPGRIAQQRSSFAANVLRRTGAVLDDPVLQSATAQAGVTPRPLSERYDYQSIEPQAPSGDEPELGD